jgi:hypothetical protein
MHHPVVRQALICVTLLAVLSACADLNDAGMAVFATRAQAYAIVNEQLVQGEMTLYSDHTGVVVLRAGEVAPRFTSSEFFTPSPSNLAIPPAQLPVLNSCVGRFRFAATSYGSIDMRCNEGSIADLRIALIGEARGYGYGQTATGLVSLTFGMGPTEARAHLTVPVGKQLLEGSGSQSLEMK